MFESEDKDSSPLLRNVMIVCVVLAVIWALMGGFSARPTASSSTQSATK